MDLDNLNFLPKWDDDKPYRGVKGDEWKTAASMAAGKALYLQWREIFGLVMAFTENLGDNSEYEEHMRAMTTKDLIYDNAMMVAPKIISVSGASLYVLQMENAAIVRKNCIEMMEQIGFAALTGIGDEAYKKVIEEAMNEFRELFKNWVATFQKDDYEDEWGLFK